MASSTVTHLPPQRGPVYTPTGVLDAAVTARADDQDDRVLPGLSPQELRVVELVAQGLTNAQIGRQLRLARTTVKGYLEHAADKLGTANRAAVAAKYVEAKCWAEIAALRHTLCAQCRVGVPCP